MKSTISRKAEQIALLRAQCGASGKQSSVEEVAAASRADYVEYMSDMIAELGQMARTAGYRELARRLDSAHEEASNQAIRRHSA